MMQMGIGLLYYAVPPLDGMRFYYKKCMPAHLIILRNRNHNSEPEETVRRSFYLHGSVVFGDLGAQVLQAVSVFLRMFLGCLQVIVIPVKLVLIIVFESHDEHVGVSACLEMDSPLILIGYGAGSFQSVIQSIGHNGAQALVADKIHFTEINMVVQSNIGAFGAS